MAKLTEYEKHFLENAIKNQVVLEQTELQKIKDTGKTPLFAKEYFNMLAREIKLKLEIK